MIPPDVVSRLQISAESTLRPVAQPLEISDKLSDLVPGQKVMAEIQALLPNGTYRALINQRNVTLALPFSAKSGDVLEMLVTESDGKVALAVAEQAAKNAGESASASLSRVGRFIAGLLSSTREGGEKPAPPALNESRPLTASPAVDRQALIPLLRQAIVQSGMFYESHQAEWIEGRFTQAALLREPQGRLSSPAAFAESHAPEMPLPEEMPETLEKATQGAQTPRATPSQTSSDPSFVAARGELSDEARVEARLPSEGDKTLSARAPENRAPEQIVAQSLHTLVQQQLEALASQKFVWQGQIWPGQSMRWEIDDEEEHHARGEEESNAERWSTRLRLDLPRLGEIDARVRIEGARVSLSLHVTKESARDRLRASGAALQTQMSEAGLAIASFDVDGEMEAPE
jgi:hypothetical protein